MDLFSPIELGPYKLANRIAMAPMTRNRAGPGNVPTASMVTYYRQRATAGLIVTEATQISPQGVGYPATPGIHSAEQIAGWRTVTDAVHAEGGRIFLQLWHVGRIFHPSLQPEGALPVSASAIQPEGMAITYSGRVPFVTPRALETSEIPGIVADYGQAAANAISAGFDGVEIHGANGYLIDQFLRDGSNKRGDQYGGSIANRTRFMMEVTEAVAAACGADRVGIRLSPVNAYNDMSDSDPDALFGFAIKALDSLGLAYLHLVETGVDRKAGGGLGAAHFRGMYGGTLITNAGFDFAEGNAAIAAGQADMIAFGKMFLANPDLPARFRTGGPFNTPDFNTFYGGNDAGYIDYPSLG